MMLECPLSIQVHSGEYDDIENEKRTTNAYRHSEGRGIGPLLEYHGQGARNVHGLSSSRWPFLQNNKSGITTRVRIPRCRCGRGSGRGRRRGRGHDVTWVPGSDDSIVSVGVVMVFEQVVACCGFGYGGSVQGWNEVEPEGETMGVVMVT